MTLFHDRYRWIIDIFCCLSDLCLYSRIQGCQKAQTSVLVISQISELIWMEFGMVLGLVGLMNPIDFILSMQYSSERNVVRWLYRGKEFMLAVIQNFIDQVLSNWIWWQFETVRMAFMFSGNLLNQYSRRGPCVILDSAYLTLVFVFICLLISSF